MFWSKIFQTRYETVVALCDEDLIDKVIDKKVRKIRISRHFYGGELIDESKAVKIMEMATIGNLIGKKIVEIGEKNKFISKENIIVIDEIPHAQFVKI